MSNPNEERTRLCKECGGICCGHIALQIDKPTSKRDYDNIRWYLLHENVTVAVDHEGDWMLEFATDCSRLGSNKMCTHYTDRPKICRDYPKPENNCEYEGDEAPYAEVFRTVEEFERRLSEKRIDWRYKNLK